MTTEEKAIEIANNVKRQKYWDKKTNDLAGNIAYQSAYIMANWKDQQFRKYLEKKRDEYIDTHKEGDLLLDYASCIDRIINELSKEEQK